MQGGATNDRQERPEREKKVRRYTSTVPIMVSVDVGIERWLGMKFMNNVKSQMAEKAS